MIARIWHGYTTPQDADSYETMLKPELLPGLRREVSTHYQVASMSLPA